MPRKAVGVDEQATRLVCNEYPGLQLIMLEKAGQPSKSPMAYKSRSLHVASFLISLVR